MNAPAWTAAPGERWNDRVEPEADECPCPACQEDALSEPAAWAAYDEERPDDPDVEEIAS